MYVVNVDTSKVTLKDRIIAAYYAFRMDMKPDMKEFIRQHEAMHAAHEELVRQAEERWVNALDNLEGYDKALADSVAGGTYNWQGILSDQLMPVIERLDTQTQIVIMQHIFRSNRQVVRNASFKRWMSSNAEDILDALPEK